MTADDRVGYCRICGYNFPNRNPRDIINHMITHKEFRDGMGELTKELDKIMSQPQPPGHEQKYYTKNHPLYQDFVKRAHSAENIKHHTDTTCKEIHNAIIKIVEKNQSVDYPIDNQVLAKIMGMVLAILTEEYTRESGLSSIQKTVVHAHFLTDIDDAYTSAQALFLADDKKHNR